MCDSNVMLQAFVVVGDSNGHVGLGVKCAKEVATAIRGAIILAKTCARIPAHTHAPKPLAHVPCPLLTNESCNTSMASRVAYAVH